MTSNERDIKNTLISATYAKALKSEGANLYSFADTSNIFQPLVEALQKTKSSAIDTRAVVVCAANAFESFLNDFAIKNSALNQCLSQKPYTLNQVHGFLLSQPRLTDAHFVILA